MLYQKAAYYLCICNEIVIWIVVDPKAAGIKHLYIAETKKSYFRFHLILKLKAVDASWGTMRVPTYVHLCEHLYAVYRQRRQARAAAGQAVSQLAIVIDIHIVLRAA